MNRKIFRITLCVLLAAMLLAAFVLPVLAAGDVSGAIESTWNEAKTQIQNVVNHVVFPVIDMILAILFLSRSRHATLNTASTGSWSWPHLASCSPASFSP